MTMVLKPAKNGGTEHTVRGRGEVQETIRTMLIEYLKTAQNGGPRRNLLDGKPVTVYRMDGPCIVFRSRSYHKFLIQREIVITVKDLAATLRGIGAEAIQLAIYRPVSEGGRTVVRCWAIKKEE